MDLAITFGLILALFALLGSGIWIGLALLGVGWLGMELFTARAAGDAMAVTIWGASSSWTLTALPMFLWMGEVLFRTRLSSDMFKGLSPWLEKLPGRLLHVNVIGCTIFAAVSGSSAATCATIGKITLPELKKRGYPEDITIGTLAGAGTLGLLIPPSKSPSPSCSSPACCRGSFWPACSWAGSSSGRCFIPAPSRRRLKKPASARSSLPRVI